MAAGRVVLMMLAIGANGLFSCGGGALLMMKKLANDAQQRDVNQVVNHPQVLEHLGEVTGFSIYFDGGPYEEEDTFIYSVTGKKRSGRVVIGPVTENEESGDSTVAKLILDDGKVIELDSSWIGNTP